MAGAYSTDLRGRVLAAVEAGETPEAAAHTAEALHQALGPALDSVTGKDVAACFQHRGYSRPGDPRFAPVF